MIRGCSRADLTCEYCLKFVVDVLFGMARHFRRTVTRKLKLEHSLLVLRLQSMHSTSLIVPVVFL